MNNRTYSVVIPVYNGSRYIDRLYDALVSFFSSFDCKDYEIVLVNDGSCDDSWKKISVLAAKNSHFKAVCLSRNFGQHNATLCGLRETCGEILITMDCDLQHDPKEIPRLLVGLEDENTQLVYGKYDQKRHGIMQNLGSWVFNKVLCDITGNNESITSFRAFRRDVIKHISNFDNPRVILDIMFSRVIGPTQIKHVVISHKDNDGESTYTFSKLVGFALDMLFNYSVVPLRIATILGLILSGLSVFVALVYLILFLSGVIVVPGFTSLILAITFLFGITLFVQGIFGEYLGRIFLIETRRPQYRVAKIVGSKK